MKKLAVVCVMLLVSGLSTQAFGTVLVYNLFGMVPTVDTATNNGSTKMVNGYLMMDFNDDTGYVDASTMVLYGRDAGSKIYSLYEDVADMTVYGDYVTVTVNTGNGDNIILTGRIWRGKRLAANLGVPGTLSGSMTLQEARLFNVDESLVGGGAMQASLNRMSKIANASPELFTSTVDSIIAALEARGFKLLVDENPPMPN